MFVVFVAPELLTVVRDAVTGRLVNKDPSPTKRANIEPAEIVEKKPYVVDITPTEMLPAVKIPVLSNVVLRTGGTYDIPPPPTRPVSKEPSPTKRP